MLVSTIYEDGEVVLYYSDNSTQRIPYTPRLLIPSHLLHYIPEPFETHPAPGGYYVLGEYPDLLHLYYNLSPLSDAILFPPPERQYLLLYGDSSFKLHLPDLPSAYLYLLKDLEPLNPGLTFAENVLFLHGYARSLKRISKIPSSPDVYIPFFHYNPDSSTIGDGSILLPTSPVRAQGFMEIHSVHPLLGRQVLSGSGTITLADALLYDLPYTIINEIHSSTIPSFFHREVRNLFHLLLSSYRSLPSTLFSEDPTPYHLYRAAGTILLSLPSILLNTYALGARGRNTLLALYNLLRRNPKVYNLLVGENDTCCPDLREPGSYLPVLSSLLMELHPS